MKLLRWPNLILVALTQYLIRYCILLPVFKRNGVESVLSGWEFGLLVLATMLIAGSGNIINDILDYKIDKKNKPHKLIINKVISESVARKGYYLLNIVGIVAGIFVAIRSGFFQLGLIFILVSVTLYIYSLRWKKMPLLGNVVVAYLSALVVGIVWLFEYFFLRTDPIQFAGMINNWDTIVFLVPGYMVFAFLLSWSREMIKDIEDVEGDRAHGCLTFPIRFGISTARWISLSLAGSTIILLGYAHIRLIGMGLESIAWYYSTIVQLFLLMLIYMAYKAENAKEFHLASTINKIAMLSGVLGAIGFKLLL